MTWDPGVTGGGGDCFMAFHGYELINFYDWLVVWLTSTIFSQKYWECLIIPIDELIFFRGVAQPPTSISRVTDASIATGDLP